jgi:hypothetical protein
MKIYNAKEVTITVAGIPIHKSGGYADGEFVRIEKEADDVLDAVGTDGEVTASLSNDDRHTITIILMQSSASNDVLSSLRARMIATRLRQGVGAIQIGDGSGRALYRGAKCWIRKPPNAAFAKEPGTREWTLRVEGLTRVDGGNIDG